MNPDVDLIFKNAQAFTSYATAEPEFTFSLLRRWMGRLVQADANLKYQRRRADHWKKRTQEISDKYNGAVDQWSRDKQSLEDEVNALNSPELQDAAAKVVELTDKVAAQATQLAQQQNQLNEETKEKERIEDAGRQWKTRSERQDEEIVRLSNDVNNLRSQSGQFHSMTHQPSSLQPQLNGLRHPQYSPQLPRVQQTPAFSLTDDILAYRERQQSRRGTPGFHSRASAAPTQRSGAQAPSAFPVNHVPHVNFATNSGSDLKYRMKVNDPSEFDGDKDKYYEWRDKMIYKLQSEDDQWAQKGPAAAVTHVSSRLTGDAYKNVQPYLPNVCTDPSYAFSKPSDILSYLDKIYGITHREKQARLDYGQLYKKASESVDKFASKFQRLVIFLTKSEEDKIEDFLDKLDHTLWEEVRRMPEPQSFEELIEICEDRERMLLDKDFREKHSDRGRTFRLAETITASSKELKPEEYPKPSSSSSKSKDDRKPSWAPDLSDPEVKAKLIEKKACFDCGGPGHRPGNPDCKTYKWKKEMGLLSLEIDDVDAVSDPDDSSSSGESDQSDSEN